MGGIFGGAPHTPTPTPAPPPPVPTQQQVASDLEDKRRTLIEEGGASNIIAGLGADTGSKSNRQYLGGM